ncbi:hypothetical protein U1Q18_020482 [Sarracenia purpurea var. burkii]
MGTFPTGLTLGAFRLPVYKRFFITSSVLDLTIVGLDAIDGDPNVQQQGQQPHYLKTCSKPNLDLGSIVYLLGYTQKKELAVGEGKVVIATDNLIKLSTDSVSWSPGSAGFDVQGNLAFMICDPMKLATSPTIKSSSNSSSSSSSWKNNNLPMQFGIPIPIICDWLNQHWEGNLDELNKPKLPLIHLMSTGQKSDQSCASFTMRRVFKSIDDENEGMPLSSSHVVPRFRDQPGPSCSSAVENLFEEDEKTLTADQRAAATHLQGIPTPEIYESPKLSSLPIQRKENTQTQFLDINFLPRVGETTVLPQPIKRQQQLQKERGFSDREQIHPVADPEISSTGSVNGAVSGVQSSSSSVEVLVGQNGYYSSEGETTMYSAETAESHNYPSPEKERFQQVGRSQSCVNYNRWGAVQRNHPSSVARKAELLQKQRSFVQGRRIFSQGATSQRSNDYFGPTVSSIMKKRNGLEQPSSRPLQNAVQSSPRWMF